MDHISAIQNNPELISLDKINEAGLDLDTNQRDDETLAVLNNNNAFVINDIVFPPPTTAFLSILETYHLNILWKNLKSN